MDDSILSTINAPGNSGIITEAYWPELKKTIRQDPLLLDKQGLGCPICYDRMQLNASSHLEDKDASHTSNSARVACCGHIFCTKCLLEYFSRSFDDAYRLRCPLCSVSWKHVFCCHVNKGCKLSILLNDPDGGPKTFLEGGRLSKTCAKCALDILANTLLRQVIPRLNTTILMPEEHFGVSLNDGFTETFHTSRALKVGRMELISRDVDLGEVDEGKMQQLAMSLEVLYESNWSDMKPVVKIVACKWATPGKSLQNAVQQAIDASRVHLSIDTEWEENQFTFYDSDDGDENYESEETGDSDENTEDSDENTENSEGNESDENNRGMGIDEDVEINDYNEDNDINE